MQALAGGGDKVGHQGGEEACEEAEDGAEGDDQRRGHAPLLVGLLGKSNHLTLLDRTLNELERAQLFFKT